MSGVSKISRLSEPTRVALNERLRAGAQGPALLKWLNDLPEVKAVLAERFGGAAVSQQNLSAWRLGGYQEWLTREAAREAVHEVIADSDWMQGVAATGEISRGVMTERLSAVLTSKYAWVLANWSRVGEAEFEQRVKTLRSVSREVARLRKGDHNMVRLKVSQDWKEEHTMKDIAELFYTFAQRGDLQAWRRIEWRDESKAREYLSRLLKTDLEGLGLAKERTEDAEAEAENQE